MPLRSPPAAAAGQGLPAGSRGQLQCLLQQVRFCHRVMPPALKRTESWNIAVLKRGSQALGIGPLEDFVM